MSFFEILGLLIAAALGATASLFRKGGAYNPRMTSFDRLPEDVPFIPADMPPIMAPTATKTPEVKNATETKETLLWDTPKRAWHSVRVLCDDAGLTYDQKNILCACIFQESRFSIHAVGRNKDPKTGKVWSTDWSIVQVNDTQGWHIGEGLRFPSVQYVLDNPEECVKWMIGVMKTTGKLKPWSSYTSKAYAQWLPQTSAMWLLSIV